MKENLADGSAGIFLATAHPAKFKDSVEEILDIELPMPKPLADALANECLAEDINFDYQLLRTELLNKLA